MCGSVLLLERDPCIRELIAMLLADEGHDVRVCASPEQVLNAASLEPSALAVVDYLGRSHRTLAADERDELARLARAVPTILMSAQGWARADIAESLGVRALVRMPFDVDELATVVRVTLDGGRLAKSA